MTTFVRVADAGSISKAARSLRLSVAMASRHVRGLEKEIGVALMHRTTRRLVLTDAGAEYLARARPLLAGVAEARDAVRPGRGAAGLLVVSLPVSFAGPLVGPIFPALLAAHPHLRLDLRFEDRFVDLVSEGVDLAIRAGSPPPDSPFVVARKLAVIDRVLCAAPRLLKKRGPIVSPAELSALPCILQGTQSAWSFEGPDGPYQVQVAGVMRSNNISALREAALTGVGVARLPLWVVDEDLRARRLVRLLPRVIMPAIDVYGMFNTGARGSPALREVLEFFQAELPRRTKMRAV